MKLELHLRFQIWQAYIFRTLSFPPLATLWPSGLQSTAYTYNKHTIQTLTCVQHASIQYLIHSTGKSNNVGKLNYFLYQSNSLIFVLGSQIVFFDFNLFHKFFIYYLKSTGCLFFPNQSRKIIQELFVIVLGEITLSVPHQHDLGDLLVVSFAWCPRLWGWSRSFHCTEDGCQLTRLPGTLCLHVL